MALQWRPFYISVGALMTIAMQTQYGMTIGTPALTSVGAIAFGLDRILFIADNRSAAIFAIDVGGPEVPLDAAIVKAEARDHAPAVDAGIAKPLSGTNAVLAYFVETIKGSKPQQSAIDATTVEVGVAICAHHEQPHGPGRADQVPEQVGLHQGEVSGAVRCDEFEGVEADGAVVEGGLVGLFDEDGRRGLGRCSALPRGAAEERFEADE